MKIEKRFFVEVIVFFTLSALLFLILFISIKNVKGNNRAVKYFNKGNFESAAQTFDNELKNNPKNYVVINNSAGADYKLNKLDETKGKYAVVINSTDVAKEDKFAALYGMGNVEFLKNNFEKSADFYREALKLNPNDKDAKYNLELALLKLNEKSSKQDSKKDDKQKNDKQKQNQQAQDLKRQMEQNNKAQKENEKKRQEEKGKSGDNKDASFQRSDNDKQKELEKEKKGLDNQKQEISDKIKNLMKDSQKEEKFQEDKKADKSEETMPQSKVKKDVNKDIQAVMLLNYYNEADKNSNKVINKNKEHLINQPQEDW
jgi:tetratricopeptide (TPR) repeat protein